MRVAGEDVALRQHRYRPALDLDPQRVPVDEALKVREAHVPVLEVVQDHRLLPGVSVPPLLVRDLPERIGPCLVDPPALPGPTGSPEAPDLRALRSEGPAVGL
ncbi:hypothetical protein NECAME_18600 [Necator americanus]|uniref:Uncharacterized protein n=1 Tax=Necator americanus TaxID=51031 RepID=W2STV5_NECAM|nr:hypothetical protein NECAME_18600 [Necator americanus]ETN72938.1 hypothetical protein NECAME_18600 [Necator americanus]